MKHLGILLSFLALVGGAAALTACGGDDDDTSNNAKAGTSNAGGKSGTAGTTNAGEGGDPSGGAFTPPPEPGKGGFWITVSGEDLASVGYDWTKDSLADGDPPALVDGWAVHFDHVIVTVANITVSSDPDKDAGNPRDVGATVARARGPWAVDAAIGGDVVGKSGSPDEKTIPIAAFSKQDDGTAFDPESRYAFSYDLVTATDGAALTNLDADGQALYDDAKAKGYSMIYAGTATYMGPAPDAQSVFANIPTEIRFTLGLKNPSSYINCHNTDLMAVGDEFPRGIQASTTKSTTVQITIHTDHAFWDRLNVEGTPLHFDAIAANAMGYGTPDQPGSVSIDDLIDVDVTGFTTRDGDPLPWRSLVSDYAAPAGQMKYDPNGTSFKKANSFAAYLAYSAAAGGHMNADGKCEIKNNFAP